VVGGGNDLTTGALELPLANHVHGFNASNDDSSTPKRLESHHWALDPFDGPVVSLNDVVEVSALTHQDIDAGVNF